MEELTLTGATLVQHPAHNHEKKCCDNHKSSNSGKNGGAVLEMTNTTQHGSRKQSHSHSHGHENGHSHSHGHSRGGGNCCGPSPAVPYRVVPKPLTKEDLLKASNEQIHNSLQILVRAATADMLEPMLQHLQALGTDKQQLVFQLGPDGHTLLHWAAKRDDHPAMLTLLLEHMKTAAKTTDQFLKFINLPSTDKVGMTPLHWAATEGSIPIVAALLQAGAHVESQDKSGCTPLLIAAQYGHPNLCAYLLHPRQSCNGKAFDNSRDTALHWAAYKGSLPVCGLLLYRNELDWTSPDAYGQTPLHLAALRGHTGVVRYLMEQGTPAEVRSLLKLQDQNGKTPLDLAIKRKRMTVAKLLQDTMDVVERKNTCWRRMVKGGREFCSYHSWKVWLGCSTPGMDEVDDAPQMPYWWTIVHVLLATLSYPLLFTPIWNISQGILWDIMGFHLWNCMWLCLLWFSLYKMKTTSPGVLGGKDPVTKKYRHLYDETVERLGNNSTATVTNTLSLCHTCHVARPMRSKHCRVAKKCVLMFDHHCPFVGNTVGLNNYKWFYLILISMSIALIGWIITMGILLHRQFSWKLLLLTVYEGLHIFPAGGMAVYHTQLSTVNLTTNEHQNLFKYSYLKNSNNGHYRNPYYRGLWNNFWDRMMPSGQSYELPEHLNEDSMNPLLTNDPVARKFNPNKVGNSNGGEVV